MPTRFAIVAALGLAMLLAGALAALGTRWPHRRRAIVALVAAAPASFELLPAPRPLYSAAISTVYDTIARDPRPCASWSCPSACATACRRAGNFRPRYQFNQTRTASV